MLKNRLLQRKSNELGVCFTLFPQEDINKLPARSVFVFHKGGSRILKWVVNFCNNLREIKYYFKI